MNNKLKNLVNAAKQGDKHALENLIQAIQHRIYGLSLKMLFHPQDAEDATQEILIRIITHLSSFAHKSSFDTWALKVAPTTCWVCAKIGRKCGTPLNGARP